MKRYQIPVAQWSVQDVQEWLSEIGLGNLNGAIAHNAVSGNDLIELAQEDLLADLGATSIQARKVKNELSKFGVPVTTKSSGYANSQAASGYPLPGTAYPAQSGYPPSGYQATMQNNEVKKSSEVAELKKQLEEDAKAAKMTEMERMLREEKMKNDMRKEMDMTSRIAATEAAQRGGGGAAPMAVSNNNNNAASGAG